jgi:hypothetical protein
LKISFYLESTCNPKIFPLLLQATIRFIEATNGSGQQVLASAGDMETLVTGMVFTVPQTLPEEYAAAEARLNRGKAARSFIADQQSSQTL